MKVTTDTTPEAALRVKAEYAGSAAAESLKQELSDFSFENPAALQALLSSADQVATTYALLHITGNLEAREVNLSPDSPASQMLEDFIREEVEPHRQRQKNLAELYSALNTHGFKSAVLEELLDKAEKVSQFWASVETAMRSQVKSGGTS